jgi:hypothetical protein
MPPAEAALPPRLLAWTSMLLLGEVLVTLFLAAGTYGLMGTLDTPTTTDFVSFYAAGKLAAAGTAALAYDPAAHAAAEWAATEPGIRYQFFFYPPVFLLLAAPLSKLPYLLAFAVFEIATLLLYLAALRPVLRGRGAAWLIPALAFPSVFWTLGLGQNAFLSAALFAAGTRVIDRRPALGGALLGALIYKPHLGLLVPVALLAGRRWRAIAGAAACVGVLVLLSGLAFGWDAWAAFIASFRGAHGTYENGRIELAGMVSVFAAARLAGLPVGVAYALQCVAAVAAAGAVALAWWRDSPLPVRAAALLAGTLLALPVVLLYDLMLLAVAGTWLVADMRARGPRPGEVVLLVAGYVTPLLCRSLGLTLNIGIAPLVAAAVLVAVLRRGRRPDGAVESQRVAEHGANAPA